MSEEPVDRPGKVELVEGPTRRFDGFFRIDEYVVRHEKFDGTMSEPQRLLVFDRGHAVAALLYDPIAREVIFVDQFRLPTYHRTIGADHRGTGWIYETAAGVIKEGERPYETLKREVEEETGYLIRSAIPIASYYSSPGGSTEMIHLYLAEVSFMDRNSEQGGLESERIYGVEGENIKLVRLDVLEFFKQLEARHYVDPKLLLAGYFLKDHLARSAQGIATGRAPVTRYRIKGSQDLVIGIKPGNILDWRDVDVWVNSENTDMEMDQFFGRGVSATIRFHGAKKHPGGKRVQADTIADELKKKRGKHGYVAPATVIETTSGELAGSHNVKRIFHVAAVEGAIGAGLITEPQIIEKSVDSVLIAIDRANDRLDARKAYKSVLMPMLGTGNAKAKLENIAPLIVARVVQYMQTKQERETRSGRHAGSLREIYLSAFDDRTDLLLRRILEAEGRLERLDYTTLTPRA
jgi:nudix-type nucleoside diphosphatase (YffH/AdpP family)